MKKSTKWLTVLAVSFMLSAATPYVLAEEAILTDEGMTEVVESPNAELVQPVDTVDTVNPDVTVDPEASIDPRMMESNAVDAVQDTEAVEKTLALAEKPSNDVAKTSTKEAVTLFGVIGGLVVGLVGYRIYVNKKK